MFVSRLRFSLDEIRNLKLWDDYNVHRMVYSLFALGEQGRSFLYYTNRLKQNGLEVIIQSEMPPYHISCQSFEVEEIPPEYFGNEIYSFKIRFSPIRKIDYKVSKLFTEEHEIFNWLISRQERLGVRFSEESMQVISKGRIKMKKNDGRDITLHYVDVTGCLKVVNKDLFLKAVKEGLGTAKGFGFGLLQVKPIKF